MTLRSIDERGDPLYCTLLHGQGYKEEINPVTEWRIALKFFFFLKIRNYFAVSAYPILELRA
jgi:hypothetical protein